MEKPEFFYEEGEPTYSVVIYKNGQAIASVGFEEQETAYDVARTMGYSAREAIDAIGNEEFV